MADFLINQGLAYQASDLNLEFSGQGLKVNYKIDGYMFPLAVYDPDLGQRLVKLPQGGFQPDPLSPGYHSGGADAGRFGSKPPGPQGLGPAFPEGERLAIRMFDKLKGSSGLDDLGFDPETALALESVSRAPTDCS